MGRGSTVSGAALPRAAGSSLHAQLDGHRRILPMTPKKRPGPGSPGSTFASPHPSPAYRGRFLSFFATTPIPTDEDVAPFLMTPHPELRGHAPGDLLENAFGFEAVK